MTADRAAGEPKRDLDAVVDAVLLSSRALVAVSARSIAAAQGVTLPQFRMLVVLSEAPSNLTGLAAALDVAPSTAMRMVDRLEAAELVERSGAAGQSPRIAAGADGRRAPDCAQRNRPPTPRSVRRA